MRSRSSCPSIRRRESPANRPYTIPISMALPPSLRRVCSCSFFVGTNNLVTKVLITILCEWFDKWITMKCNMWEGARSFFSNWKWTRRDAYSNVRCALNPFTWYKCRSHWTEKDVVETAFIVWQRAIKLNIDSCIPYKVSIMSFITGHTFFLFKYCIWRAFTLFVSFSITASPIMDGKRIRAFRPLTLVMIVLITHYSWNNWSRRVSCTNRIDIIRGSYWYLSRVANE